MLVANCSNKTKKIISKRLQETAGRKKKNIFKSWPSLSDDGRILVPFSTEDGWTTTCMVVTPPGMSHSGLWHSPTVLLFSSIFPALINLTSFNVLGPFSFSGQILTGLNTSNYISWKLLKTIESIKVQKGELLCLYWRINSKKKKNTNLKMLLI